MVGVLVVCLFAGTPVQSLVAERSLTPEEPIVQRDFGAVKKELAGTGLLVFNREGCMNCHRVGAKGRADTGPNLGGVGKRQADPQWYVDMLKDPASKQRSSMPAFDDLTEKDLRALAEYLRSLKN